MKSQTLKNILKTLKDQRGFDFSGYRSSMLERRLQKRIFSTKSANIEGYQEYLIQHPEELDQLIDVFTINVSRFFRNTLSFEYIRKIVIPDLFIDKAKNQDNNFRIWSAGCSFGEEPYSLAILLNEYIKKEKRKIDLNIFATDIDKKALQQAAVGSYSSTQMKDVKYGILQKHFSEENDQFRINPEIKEMVRFSFFDMLDKNASVPPDSIFGGFDIVLCRNVLIYFNTDFQKTIFEKLYKSLNPNGYLILGESEVPIEGFKHKFKKENKYSKIYRKIG